MAISQNAWKRLFPGVLKIKPYSIILHDDNRDGNTDKAWVDVAEAWNETLRHTEEYTVHNSHGTDVDSHSFDAPIKPLAEEGLSQQSQIFADAEAAGRALLENQFPDVSVSRLLYCANTTLVFQAEDKALGQVAIKLTGIKSERRSDMEATLSVLKDLGKETHLMPLLHYAWMEAEKGRTVLIQWMPCLHRAQPKAKPGTGTEVLGIDLSEMPHIRKIGADIATALEVLHSKGLVHLDVKLDNLFFTTEDGVLTAYLGDYSSVKLVERQYEGQTSFTSDHAAPELRAGMSYSYGVDIYAWGQMMLRLLANLTASGPNLVAFVASKHTDVNYVQILEESSGKQVDSFHATDAHIPFLPTVIRAVNRNTKVRYADGNALYTDLQARLTFDPSIFRVFPAYKACPSKLPSADHDCQDSIEWVIWSRTEGSGPYHVIDHLSLVRDRDGRCSLCQEAGDPMTGLFVRHRCFDDTISLEDYWNLVRYFSSIYARRESVERDWKEYIHCDYDSACGDFRSRIISNAQRNVYRNIDINNLDLADWFTSCSDPYPPLIEHIGKTGISGLEAEFEKRTIRISLTEEFRNHRNCTAYLLINWLDGVLNVFSMQEEPATLVFYTPAPWQDELTELKRYLKAKNPWLAIEEFFRVCFSINGKRYNAQSSEKKAGQNDVNSLGAPSVRNGQN